MYSFSLEPLLTQRRFHEESLQKELAAIQDQFNNREKALRRLIASREGCSEKLRDIGAKGARIAELRLYSEYFKRLSIEAFEMEQTLDRLEEKLGAKRSEVVEAMKGRKILENLKERGLQAYRCSIRKKEMQSADETAIARFNRKAL